VLFPLVRPETRGLVTPSVPKYETICPQSAIVLSSVGVKPKNDFGEGA